MELADYLTLLRRRGIYLLVGLIAGLVGGYSVAKDAKPTYTSTIRLYVSTATPNETGLLASLSQVATSSGVIAQSSAKAPGNGSVSVSAAPEGASSVLGVTVTSSDAARATATAAAFGSTLPAAFSRYDTFAQVSLQVLDQSGAKSTPLHKSQTIAIGGILGLIVGFAAALLREALDRSVRDPQELETRLEMPLQGVIPGDRTSKGIVTWDRPQSPRAEAYRRLSASLRLAPGEGGYVRVLGVTSAASSEGKTTTALNLAQATADSGERVLIIDADLRRPNVARVLGLSQTPGLSDVLSGGVTLDEAITRGGRFHAMVAGTTTHNPVELLRSPQFVGMLRELRNRYDLVVIDTPAALSVADAEVVGAACDAVLFVARLASTPRNRSVAGAAVMRRGGSRMWGVVSTFAGDAELVPFQGRRQRKELAKLYDAAVRPARDDEPDSTSKQVSAETATNRKTQAGDATEAGLGVIDKSSEVDGESIRGEDAIMMSRSQR